jgi:hypothetical protein
MDFGESVLMTTAAQGSLCDDWKMRPVAKRHVRKPAPFRRWSVFDWHLSFDGNAIAKFFSGDEARNVANGLNRARVVLTKGAK